MASLTLDVYLDEGCFGCARAEQLASHADSQFPQLRVVIHWLHRGARLPAGVVAVPAFLLGGRLLQYGTPREATLTRAIAAALDPPGRCPRA